MGIVDRIQLKLKEKGTNIKTLEKEAGIGNGTIRRWDERSPQCDKISLVANYLQVSIDWLLFGKEERDLTPEEQQLLKAYRLADPAVQSFINKALDIEPDVSMGKLSISEDGEKAI